MTFEEFKDLCGDIAYVTDDTYQYSFKGDAIFEQWTTGGMGGGSCWEDGGHYAVEGEPEPEFESLDKIIVSICPNITFIQYKKLCREVIKRDEYTNNEYYGNYSRESIKYVLIEQLYNALKEQNLF
jgi:hypothetical protein